MKYEPKHNFSQCLAESRRKHEPLYMSLALYAETPCMYYEAGPINVKLTAGDLVKCRKPDMDPALAKRIGAGKVFRMSYGKETRILFKLWWDPKKGYITRDGDRSQRVEHVFDVPEERFLYWMDYANREELV